MTNHLTKFGLLCITGFILITSCSKKLEVNSGNGSSNTIKTDSTVTSVKKGSDFNTNSTNGTWSADVVNLKSSWFYTWGNSIPSDPTPQNIEFVPMFWGAGDVTTNNITSIINLKNQGKVNFILGFNEPDRSDQANMSVHDALALWPQLEAIGLPLGSPAADWPTQQWIYDFMDSSIAQNRRVDFICVHMYVGTDDVAFVQVLQDLYTKYHKPIWITEFATADFNASSISQNPYSPQDVLGFMQRLLPKLDSLPFIQRYSWFSGDPNSPALYSSALVDAKGNLTALGKWYAAYKP